MNNYPLPDTVRALCSKHGITGPDATTMHRSFVNAILTAPADDINALGFRYLTPGGNYLGTVAVMQQIKGAAEKIGRDAYLEKAAPVFGSDAIRLVVIALEEHK